MTAQTTTDDWHDTLTDTLGLRDREASAVEVAYPSVDSLVDALREGADLSTVDGVGDQTRTRLMQWFQDEHHDAYRERLQNDEGICLTFTTDHGLDESALDDGKFYWAFVCPRCEATNPLVGNPAKFKNRPYKCETCAWVPLLEGEAIDAFRAEHYEPTEATA
ncbi:helix-hairpin-helix domain-containing protein [Halostella litorea]|uniref:hypothetical protein n=1 Tax=Halostella litorea TaxID=2528831 RepID=UPI001091B000|nr:hypothetical protein [Halostella litorea]